MANEEQLAILRQGVEVWNKWREENPDEKIDLSNADLRYRDLEGVNLGGFPSRVNLKDVQLSGSLLRGGYLAQADLIRANLTSVNLSDAILIGADLNAAILNNTKLNKTVFNNSHLLGTIFIKTELDVASFEFADMGQTIFAAVDLSNCVGLESIFHHASSYLSTDTLLLSKGKIPLKFLRSCGVSDIQIESAKLNASGIDPAQVTDITYKIYQLYLGRGIQHYSCFISYSGKDKEFAQRIYDDLQDNGVRCWFDLEDIQIGDRIRPTIDREIRLRDKLLVILSEHSIQSEYVGDEVEAALEEEQKSKRLVVFPIRIDDAPMNTRDDWAAKIKRRRHIGDFSNWKDEVSYKKAFDRLLRDLKSTSG